MSQAFFSDREGEARPRTQEEITDAAWRGIVALLVLHLDDGSLGRDFPEYCPDGPWTIGASQPKISNRLIGLIPELGGWPKPGSRPRTPVALDLVDFIARHVAEPVPVGYHDYYKHWHFPEFDEEAGRERFRAEIDEVFARNGIAFEIGPDNRVRRLGPPVVRETLRAAVFKTGDRETDALLEVARERFLDPKVERRREGLEKLWDAFERVKTLEPGKDKKAKTTALLDRVAGQGTGLRARLETESFELTNIGNSFQIRHTETDKEPVSDPAIVDYLFARAFALVWLELQKTGRVA
jgi:hypothetical protein